MYWKTGLAAQVSRGGRGCGTSASHISRPWCAGSAVSSRCSAVVPVLGSPVTNTGRSIGIPAYSGCACQPASLSSRAASAPRSIERITFWPSGVRAAASAHEESSTASPSV